MTRDKFTSDRDDTRQLVFNVYVCLLHKEVDVFQNLASSNWQFITDNSAIPHLSEAVVWLRTMFTLWHSWILDQSFLDWTRSITLFLLKSFFRGQSAVLSYQRRPSSSRKWEENVRVPTNLFACFTQFVPNDRLQCLCCVLPVICYAFVAHLHVGLAK